MYRLHKYDLKQYVSTGLILSLLIHMVFAISISQQRTPVIHPPMIINAVLAPELGKMRRQIVSPSDTSESKPPKNTNLLSDKDSSVAKEQIKRGDSPLAGPAPGKAGPTSQSQTQTPSITKPENPAQSENSTQPKSSAELQSPLNAAKQESPKEKAPSPTKNAYTLQEKKPAPPRKNLDLSPRSDFLKDLKAPPAKTKAAKAPELAPQLSKPFSRAAGSGAQFLGFNGNSDYLPNIRDGDVTLLNAKADKYAVFVRRVAIRVFHLLKQYGWEYMRASDFQSLTRHTAVRATLSSEGRFLSVTLEDSSGNRIFDDIVERSIADGASDPNPPAGAKLADGTYRFVFLARSWSRTAGSRQGGLQERRWLSLRTGLE